MTVMMSLSRIAVSILALVALSAVPLPADVELPAGRVAGGVVDDKGRIVLVVRRTDHPADGSVLVKVEGKKTRQIGLPNMSVRRVSALPNGRLLLSGSEIRSDGSWDAVDQIIGAGSGEKVRLHWKFSSREFDPLGNHGVPIDISGDGKAWGLVDERGTSFVFGRTRSRNAKIGRADSADVGGERDVANSELKWPMAPGFIFLDSDGPVVLTPWTGGAYILHCSKNGSSPHVVPILFGDGVEEYEFRWQWEERVLWVRTSLYWRAYNLWDLDLSPMQEQPILTVGISSAEPHPKRGAVVLAAREGSYRIEHLWRDPWSPVGERHVSDWYPGQPTAFFVSPGGRHAVAIETRESGEGESGTHARRIELTSAPPLPSIRPDVEAEIAADRALMPWLQPRSENDNEVPRALEDARAAQSEAAGTREGSGPDAAHAGMID